MSATQREKTGRSSQFVDRSPAYAFVIPDDITTTDNDLNGVIPGQGKDVQRAQAQIVSAPTGAALTADIQIVDRATGAVDSTLATITIPDGALFADATFAKTNIPTNKALTIAITQVGSTTPGRTLTVVVS